MRILWNSQQAVPWHRRLTNGSSTFEFWYNGISVGLRAKTLDNHWAIKRISVYSLAHARITTCRWINDKSSTLGKTFYAKMYPLIFAVTEQSGFFTKMVRPLLRKSVIANFAKCAPSTPQHWALTNGSSTFDICYRGRSVCSKKCWNTVGQQE